MDRRAFGEFIGPRGELASYAIGWRTDDEAHAGRITVGIGAGNPGGGTIHAAVFSNEGSPAFSLLDEPFASVPEGGPHKTREEALAMEDLPFVWWVADHVILKDHRAMWMCHWVVGTLVAVSDSVFEMAEPVLRVTHDDDDDRDWWQALGAQGAVGKPRIAHLSHSIDEDPTIMEVLDLERGEQAEREYAGGPWTRSTIEQEQ